MVQSTSKLNQMILCEDKNYISASERCNNTKFSEADEPQRLPYRNCFEILDVVTEDLVRASVLLLSSKSLFKERRGCMLPS